MKSEKMPRPIGQVHDMPNANVTLLMPVARNYFENWNIRVVDRVESGCDNYLSPNRRDFYKIMFITQGTGLKTVGTHNYRIEKPTIMFLHPNEIVCCRHLSSYAKGVYCLFKKRDLEQCLPLKSVIDRYKFFTEKRILELSAHAVHRIQDLFTQMLEEAASGGLYVEDSLQAFLQLILIESLKEAHFPLPRELAEEYSQVHSFFKLLVEQTATINLDNPIRTPTVEAYAEQLQLSPNYLNALLKKYTGQNSSRHIKKRLLFVSKALLLQTDWTFQAIGQCISFADQPNFSQFFKK